MFKMYHVALVEGIRWQYPPIVGQWYMPENERQWHIFYRKTAAIDCVRYLKQRFSISARANSLQTLKNAGINQPLVYHAGCYLTYGAYTIVYCVTEHNEPGLATITSTIR